VTGLGETPFDPGARIVLVVAARSGIHHDMESAAWRQRL
jgi:hypothetical protein